MDEKKKTPEEEQEKKAPEADAPEEKKEEPQADKPESEAPDKAEEPKQEDKPQDKAADEQTDGKSADEPADKPDDKDEEILRLKTQIAAMQLGVSAEAMDDAVALAESYVRNGSAKDISAALSAVVKKYPDMKGKEGSSSGFKVGAGSSEGDEKKANKQTKQTAQKRWNKFK